VAAERRRGSGLDQPKSPGMLTRPSIDPETAGRVSERIARFLGSWRFIGYMTVFVLLWVLWNAVGPESLRFDPWPFIGLTLLLSLQASYAAPLILLAQNRQTDRDRIQYQEDRSQAERVQATTEYLTREIAALRMALGEVATRDFLRGELRDLVDEIEERMARPPDLPDERPDVQP